MSIDIGVHMYLTYIQGGVTYRSLFVDEYKIDFK